MNNQNLTQPIEVSLKPAIIVLYCYEPSILKDLNNNTDKIIFEKVPTSLIIQNTNWYFFNIINPDLENLWKQFNCYIEKNYIKMDKIYLYKPNKLSNIEDDVLMNVLLNKKIWCNTKIYTISNIF